MDKNLDFVLAWLNKNNLVLFNYCFLEKEVIEVELTTSCFSSNEFNELYQICKKINNFCELVFFSKENSFNQSLTIKIKK